MSQFSRILRYSKYRAMDCLCGMTLPDLNSKLSAFLKQATKWFDLDSGRRCRLSASFGEE